MYIEGVAILHLHFAAPQDARGNWISTSRLQDLCVVSYARKLIHFFSKFKYFTFFGFLFNVFFWKHVQRIGKRENELVAVQL